VTSPFTEGSIPSAIETNQQEVGKETNFLPLSLASFELTFQACTMGLKLHIASLEAHRASCKYVFRFKDIVFI